MKPRDLFGLILRATCLFLIVWGAWYIIAGMKYLLSAILTLDANESSLSKPFSYLAYGVPAFISGVIGIRIAERLVDFTYIRDAKPPPLSVSTTRSAPRSLPPDPAPAAVAPAAGQPPREP